MTSFEPIFKKSHRAKNLIIRITAECKVVVTLPYGIPIRTARSFIDKKRDWIHQKLRNFQTERVSFRNNSIIPYFDNELLIEIIYTKVPKTKVFIQKGKLLVFANKYTRQRDIKASIIKALKIKFKEQVMRTIDKYNSRNTFKIKRVAIKDNSTNWGSCSAEGNLNFNWRLIFAPKKIVEYVVVHELCHIKQHNHSKAFWDLVESFYPNYENGRNWLKENGHKLSVL